MGGGVQISAWVCVGDVGNRVSLVGSFSGDIHNHMNLVSLIVNTRHAVHGTRYRLHGPRYALAGWPKLPGELRSAPSLVTRPVGGGAGGRCLIQ